MTFLGPFPLTDAIARLDSQVPALRLVGTAADLRTALDSKPAAAPAAFVLKEERSDRPAGASGGLLVQMSNVTVQVVLMVQNVRRSATGDDARKDMDALIADVRGALLKWSPDNTRFFHGLSHMASRDESYSGGWLVAQEIFQTRYPIEVRP